MSQRSDTVVRPGPLDWVVVANAARARIHEWGGDHHRPALREIADLAHDASRLMKGAQLQDDRPGHVRKSQASTSFEPHTDPHVREHLRFAREVADLLEHAALEHRMPGLILMASDPFLGVLKGELGDASKRLQKAAVVLDLTAFEGLELARRVAHALGCSPAEDASG